MTRYLNSIHFLFIVCYSKTLFYYSFNISESLIKSLMILQIADATVAAVRKSRVEKSPLVFTSISFKYLNQGLSPNAANSREQFSSEILISDSLSEDDISSGDVSIFCASRSSHLNNLSSNFTYIMSFRGILGEQVLLRFAKFYSYYNTQLRKYQYGISNKKYIVFLCDCNNTPSK